MVTIRQKKKPKIGILRALQLGDMLCGVPAVRAIRKAFPEASITLIGLPWAKEFVKRFETYFDSFIEFPGFPGLPEQGYEPKEIVSFIKHMQKEAFDLVIQMHGGGIITNPLVTLFNAPLTAGSYITGNFCPNPSTYTIYNNHLSEVQRCLAVIEKLGIPVDENQLEFPIRTSEMQELTEKGYGNLSQYICIHPGARDIKRRWQPEYFAHVADALSEQGYIIIITGTKDEESVSEEVSRNMRHTSISAVGKLRIGATAALIRSSQLVISNCTSISHIADALHVPSIIIFLTSDPQRWAPVDKKLHIPIMGKNTERAEVVVEKAVELLKRYSKSSFLSSRPNEFYKAE